MADAGRKCGLGDVAGGGGATEVTFATKRGQIL
jgi:hypothetical protein